ncbi:MAG TPA: hypothetical protein VGK40_02290 [Verrucomicrobiae bacterium]|jgi:hypothetical protein
MESELFGRYHEEVLRQARASANLGNWLIGGGFAALIFGAVLALYGNKDIAVFASVIAVLTKGAGFFLRIYIHRVQADQLRFFQSLRDDCRRLQATEDARRIGDSTLRDHVFVYLALDAAGIPHVNEAARAIKLAGKAK